MGKSERRRYPTEDENASSYDALAYEHIADEYYDPLLHPTCLNFRNASVKAIGKLKLPSREPKMVVDLGAGKSILPELTIGYKKAILVDSSINMIKHSSFLCTEQSQLIHMIVADAWQLPFDNGTFDLIIISLGDPFNLPPLWEEVSRIMKASGVCMFTTPSYDWATRFRWRERDEVMDRALFLKRSAEKRFVPSFIWNKATQDVMFKEADLVVREITSVTVSEIIKPISWKLLIDGGELSVVTGYIVEKRCRGLTSPR